MRRLAIALLALTTLAAAPGANEAYLAARDKALTTYAHPTPADDARVGKVLAALDPLVAAAVGPIAVAGFPAKGKSNVDVLSLDQGFGKLDGVRIVAGKTVLLVSNQGLLQAWLKDPRFWDDTGTRPEFGTAEFLFNVMRGDAAAIPATDLPVTGGNAAALLFQYAQDTVGASPPNQIGVSVQRDDRVYVFVTETKVAEVPACTAAYKKDHAAAEAMVAAYQKSGSKDEALFDRSTKAEEAANTKAQACIATQLKTTPAWATLVATAQRLVDLTAPK